MRIIVFMLLILMVPTLAYAADGCRISENCTWWAYDETGASTSATLNIKYPNGTNLTNNASMIKQDSYYYYTNIINQSGNYIGTTTFINSSGVIGVAAETKEVSGMVPFLTHLLILALLIGIGGIFGWFAVYSNNYVYFLVTAVWYMANAWIAAEYLRYINPFFSATIFLVLGLIALIEASEIVKSNRGARYGERTH